MRPMVKVLGPSRPAHESVGTDIALERELQSHGPETRFANPSPWSLEKCLGRDDHRSALREGLMPYF
jgi:hypothetical protein